MFCSTFVNVYSTRKHDITQRKVGEAEITCNILNTAMHTGKRKSRYSFVRLNGQSELFTVEWRMAHAAVRRCYFGVSVTDVNCHVQRTVPGTLHSSHMAPIVMLASSMGPSHDTQVNVNVFIYFMLHDCASDSLTTYGAQVQGKGQSHQERNCWSSVHRAMFVWNWTFTSPDFGVTWQVTLATKWLLDCGAGNFIVCPMQCYAYALDRI